jgi:DNA modification methylase
MSDLQWPADKVERWAVERLVPYANNARTHSEAQIDQLVASIKQWGWTVPVLADESGMLIAGHGRVLAAQKMGLAEVPVMVALGWTEEQKRAYILADNQLAISGSGWDEDLLRAELEALAALDFEIPVIGFDEAELTRLLASADAGATDPDDVPEPPAVPVTRPGDVWVLGSHRIICGDSTCAADVETVLDGNKPHLMVTDPPYGVEYDAAWREGSGLNRKGAATGKVLNDDRADWSEAWALFPGEVAYVWHGGLHAQTVAESLIASGFLLRSQIIWAKQQMVISRGDYHWQHEPCWYAVRKGGKGYYGGGRKQTTIWDIPKPMKSETGHSTQKPVECMKRPIENNSKPGDAVYEPFSGSGTTIIAAQMTGRRCFAVELNPPYVDVAVKRWQDFALHDAVLEETGQSFAEVAKERLA